MDFAYSTKVRELLARLATFMECHIYPNEQRYHAEVEANRNTGNAWKATVVIEELKKKARDEGLWNSFLPESDYGASLTNLEYAPLAEMMGRSYIAPEVFNCPPPTPATWRC